MKYFTICLLCIVIILLLYVNINIVEGAGPELPSGTNQASIKTIDDMRTFLEQMYMVSILNPNDTNKDNRPNTTCYKVGVLSTFLWPILGPYTYWSLNELSPLFGKSTAPTSMAQNLSNQTNTTPPPVPILANDTDYQLFLELAVLGQMIQPFGSENNGRCVLWIMGKDNRLYDYCIYQNWRGYQKSYDIMFIYFERIKTILSYFHAQTESANKVKNADDIYTSY